MTTSRRFTLVLTVCLFVHGCVDATGGAVEVSWSLRDISGETTTCDDARVADMHLYWQIEGRTRDDVWSCGDGRGVTGFDLEPGTVSLWLEPECANGPARQGSYRAPPLIVRTITEGDVITLETQLIEVRAVGCDDDCTCP